MIIDTIENIDFYQDLKIYNILKYIKNTNFESKVDGKYELDGENLFYSISTFNTRPFEDCIWESHYRYTDIQYMVMGSSIIACISVE